MESDEEDEDEDNIPETDQLVKIEEEDKTDVKEEEKTNVKEEVKENTDIKVESIKLENPTKEEEISSKQV